MVALHPPLDAFGGGSDTWEAPASALLDAVLAALRAASARIDRADAMVVVARHPEVAAALEAGFAVCAAAREIGGHAHGRALASVGIGWGHAVAGAAGLIGPELLRAWRLASLGAGEVLATDALVRAGSLPAGIGSFRAPPAREAMAGVIAYVIGDFRA